MQQGSEDGQTSGKKVVLNLDPNTTQVYVGVVPDGAELESRLKSLRFIGGIEAVQFDGHTIGLWNYISNAEGAKSGEAKPPLRHSFNGAGYMLLKRGNFNPGRRSVINMDIQTFSSNGLLLLMGNDEKNTDFISLQMEDGKIAFQYDLGSGSGK